MHRSPAFALALACAFAPLCAADESQFETRSRSFQTGHRNNDEAYNPQAVAAVDLDGDGDLDLAFAHVGKWISPRISLLFNVGDGTYGAPVFYAAPDETMDVVAADLDGDGDPDLAFAASAYGTSGNRVVVYRNQGNGTLAPAVSYVVGQGPTGVDAFDVDNDGDFDLVTANNRWNESDVTVLYNDGTGTFGGRKDFAIPNTTPYQVAAGDLNGDGWADVAVSVGTSVAMLLNDQTGNLRAPVMLPVSPAQSSSVPGVAIADIDNDADLDILFGVGPSGSFNAAISLFRNAGGGVFGAPQALDAGGAYGAGHSLAVADLTQDGWPDVVTCAHSDSYGFAVIPSDGSGGFGAGTAYRSGEMARDVALGDADGDGDIDVFIANSGSLNVTVHRNDSGALAMPPVYDLSNFQMALAAGDIDIDGDIDIIAAENDVQSLTNDGSGNFVVTLINYSSGKLEQPTLRDLDGDAVLDLVALRGSEVWLARGNAATGVFGAWEVVPLGSCCGEDLAVTDLDGDGDFDLSVAMPFSNVRVVNLLNNGDGTFGAPMTESSTGLVGAKVIVAGDFDVDGKNDIVTGHGDFVAFWKGNGNGDLGLPLLSGTGAGGTTFLTSGDFDADGSLDLATTSNGSSFEGANFTVLRGNGFGNFGPAKSQAALFSQQYGLLGGLATLDATGDGTLDVAAGCYGAQDIALFVGRGDASFEPERRFGVDGVVMAMDAADLDGDGLADLFATIGTGTFGTGLTVLFNAGPFSFQDLGLGLSGTNGALNLAGVGTLAPGVGFELVVQNAFPAMPGLHVVGVERLDAPFSGGTLVPLPNLLLSVVADANGEVRTPAVWPSAGTLGLTLYAQSWFVEPSLTLAATNGLKLQQQQ